MQKTPLAQKLILLMLVLIFGALVMLLINARKQMETLRGGNGQEAIISTNTNQPADLHRAFPTMRSSKPHPKPVAQPDPPAKASAPVQSTMPKQVDPPAVTEKPATVMPVPVPVEAPKELDDAPVIFGRVTLGGIPPPEIVIRFDPTCGKFHAPNTRTQRYIVSPDGGLANAFVYISNGLEGKKFPTPTQPVLIDQKGCMYQPYLSGVMVNQPIQIRNSDPVMHNVHALPRKSDEFNFAQPTQGQVDIQKFSKPELFIKMKCDVHDWMLSYVCVLSHPYFAVTDTNGDFILPLLPPGKYEVTVAHLRAGTASQTVVLKEKGHVEVNFKLPVQGKPWLGLKAP